MLLTTVNSELLVCQFSEELVLKGSSNGLTIVRSPLSCLGSAIYEAYAAILIYFSGRKLSEREVLIELCAQLNKNAHTGDALQCVLLDCPHRSLLASLRKVGVKHVAIGLSKEATDPWRIWERCNVDDHTLQIEWQLSLLCPFLYYRSINAESELITCGAYRNRMVLGGKRLHEVCQTEGYLHCPYYLDPQVLR